MNVSNEERDSSVVAADFAIRCEWQPSSSKQAAFAFGKIIAPSNMQMKCRKVNEFSNKITLTVKEVVTCNISQKKYMLIPVHNI